MEGNQQNHPLLPPNYVSLADLKERWMIKQQQEEQKREKVNQEEEPQQPNLTVQEQIGQDDAKHKPQFQEPMKSSTSSNPNRNNRSPICRTYGNSKSEIEGADAVRAEIDERRMKKKGKKQKKQQKQNLVFKGESSAMNGAECGEERGSGRMIMGDRTADIGESCKRLSVSASEWMNNVRSRVAMEGSRGMFRAYRGMGKNMRENGLVWVKKEEVSD